MQNQENVNGNGELLPCPFCGSPAEIGHGAEDYGYRPPTVLIFCSGGVPCPKPRIVRAKSEYDWDKREHVDISEKAEAEVIRIWNTRDTTRLEQAVGCDRPAISEQLRTAVEAEREACAQIVEECAPVTQDMESTQIGMVITNAANTIRARGAA